MKHFLVVLFATMYGSAAISASQAGNGGDPIMQLFEGARDIAVTALKSLKRQDFAASVPAETVEMFVARQSELVGDVTMSKHVWAAAHSVTPVTPGHACDMTALAPHADITLSLQICRDQDQIRDVDVAAELLIHESLHHVGIADEAKVVTMAYTIYRTWLAHGGHTRHFGEIRLKSGIYKCDEWDPGQETKIRYRTDGSLESVHRIWFQRELNFECQDSFSGQAGVCRAVVNRDWWNDASPLEYYYLIAMSPYSYIINWAFANGFYYCWWSGPE